MKVKTSVTLSPELLAAIDRHAGAGQSRSDFVERSAWAFVARLRREVRDARDLRRINRRAAQLNREAEDVLGYQIPL
jgi:Arc/MetJ-type ribon-helix-helix transcriptional regulator